MYEGRLDSIDTGCVLSSVNVYDACRPKMKLNKLELLTVYLRYVEKHGHTIPGPFGRRIAS